jgi:anti-sigma regulatory factor (Ser/Thr protein kinase)
MVRDACTAWEVETLAETAALVVTELVTNAIEHARSASRLRLTVDGEGLRIAVRDHRRTPPVPRPRPVAVTRGAGCGLHLVAMLSAADSVLDHPDGKTVWAHLGPPSG